MNISGNSKQNGRLSRARAAKVIGRGFCAALVAAVISMSAALVHAETASQYEMRTEKQRAKRLKSMAELTAEDVAKAVTVTDDPFEPVVTLSSAPAFPSPRSFTDRILGENFFRVFVDPKTGEATFQLYQTLGYLGEWRNFDRVSIMLPSGLRTTRLTRINDEIRQCYSVNMCGRTDTVGFDLSEEDMEAIAAMKPDPNGTPALLRFRFKSNTSFDWTDDISSVEAAGVLIALKRWREAKGF